MRELIFIVLMLSACSDAGQGVTETSHLPEREYSEIDTSAWNLCGEFKGNTTTLQQRTDANSGLIGQKFRGPGYVADVDSGVFSGYVIVFYPPDGSDTNIHHINIDTSNKELALALNKGDKLIITGEFERACIPSFIRGAYYSWVKLETFERLK